MKSKQISTLDLLKLKRTWSLVALIITLLVIPYFVMVTLYIRVIGLIYSIFYQTMSPIFGSIWLGGFWLCIVLLLIVLSYALTKVLQKWKSENQRLLSLSLSFFLIVVYFLNRIYFWDYSETVSYTHLDVYKRQGQASRIIALNRKIVYTGEAEKFDERQLVDNVYDHKFTHIHHDR